MEEFPRVRMVIFLAGGVVADHPPGNEVLISLGLNSPPIARLTLERYEHLFRDVSRLGPALIACQIYSTELELIGLHPPQLHALRLDKWFAVNDAAERWRNMSQRAVSARDMRFADCSRRIAFGLRCSETKLVELCLAYGLQLRVLKGNESGRPFDDPNTQRIVKATHALFAELAALCDTFAEFVAAEMFNLSPSDDARIQTMAGLREKLLAKPEAELGVFARSLLSATEPSSNPPGWVAELTAYRNLFAHIAPLDLTDVRTWSVLETVSISNNPSQGIYRPLPANIFELSKSRSAGFSFEAFQAWLDASASHSPKRPENPDALEYLHGALIRLAELLAVPLEHPRYSTEPIETEPSDIIGSPT